MKKVYGNCEKCGRLSGKRRIRGMCSTCYRHALEDPTFPRVGRVGLRIPIEQRLLSRVVAGWNGCWIWTGEVLAGGYGVLPTTQSGKRRNILAHRASYKAFVGPIPDGLVLDHLCRTRRCINPGHLEPVTQQENTLRSPFTLAYRWAIRTHCERGHEYTPENTVMRPRRDNPEKFWRDCRACWRARAAAKRERGAS